MGFYSSMMPGDNTSPTGLGSRGSQGRQSGHRDDDLQALKASTTAPTSPHGPQAAAASDLACSAIPARWRLPVVALLAGLCLIYVSELTTFTRDVRSSAYGGGQLPQTGEGDGGNSPSVYEALGFAERQMTMRDGEEEEGPTTPPQDPELLGYSRSAHVPEDCRLNKTKVRRPDSEPLRQQSVR